MSSSRLSFYGCDIKSRLKAFEFHCEPAQFWHILGANGSGKSTFLLALSGLLPVNKLMYNQVDIKQQSLIQLAQIRALLSQHHSSEFAVPLSQLLSFFTQHKQLPDELDKALELNSLLTNPLNKLSGGQQQRFHIARTILQIWQNLKQGQGILILDEPLQGLDIKHQFQVLDLLESLCQLGNSVIMSCHDINLSYDYASQCLMLKNGDLVIQGEAKKCLTCETMSRVFGVTFSELYGKPVVDYNARKTHSNTGID